MVKDFVEPNDIFRQGASYSFVYINPTNKLYIDYYTTHWNLVARDDELMAWRDKWGTGLWGDKKWDALFGRLASHKVDGKDVIMVAFWEQGPLTEYKYRYILDCLDKLGPYIDKLKSNYPEAPVLISVSKEGVFPIEEVEVRLGLKKGTTRISQAERDRLRKELKNATGKERKRILSLLGMDTDDEGPLTWRRALARTGYTYPPFSENKYEHVLDLLEDSDEEEHFDYIDPDSIYHDSSISFIYVNSTNKLYYSKYDTHSELVKQHAELSYQRRHFRSRFLPNNKLDSLFGRISYTVVGNKKMILIAFWEPGPITNHVYRNILDCLRKLEPLIDKYKAPDPRVPVMMSIYGEGVFPVKEIKARLGLHRKLKRDVPGKQDKVVDVPREKDADPLTWRQALARTGFTYPPYSEGKSFEDVVNHVVEHREGKV